MLVSHVFVQGLAQAITYEDGRISSQYMSVSEILGLIWKDSTNEANMKFPIIIQGNQMKPKINKCICRSNMALQGNPLSPNYCISAGICSWQCAKFRKNKAIPNLVFIVHIYYTLIILWTFSYLAIWSIQKTWSTN